MKKSIFSIIFIGVIALAITACGTKKNGVASGIDNHQMSESVVSDEAEMNDEISLSVDNWEDYFVLGEIERSDSSLKSEMAFRLKDQYKDAECKFHVKVKYSGHYVYSVVGKNGNELPDAYKEEYPKEDETIEEEIGFYFIAGVDEPGFLQMRIEYDEGEIIRISEFILDSLEVVELEGYLSPKP